MRVFYSPEYAGSAYAFETTRKARWVAESLAASPIADIELVPPEPLTCGQLLDVHDKAYVRAVQTGEPRWLAESQGFDWDPGLWPMVLSSNGGVVGAALDAMRNGLSGSLSSGLHHARRDRGAGFCTFNGLVIAARAALAAGAESVLILDLDAHCGGGTAALIGGESRIWQLDVAVCTFDLYAVHDGSGPGRKMWLRVADDAGRYLAGVKEDLEELGGTAPRFGLCLYNAGMDPCEGCSTGGLGGITRDVLDARERLVFEWCREHAAATAFVLAGGYIGRDLDAEGLVALHRLTLSAAAESAAVESAAVESAAESAVGRGETGRP
jgi:acetoin utilization deacetylase AcuC-like enzyme